MRTLPKTVAAAALAVSVAAMAVPANAQVSFAMRVTPSYNGIQAEPSRDSCNDRHGRCGPYGYHPVTFKTGHGYWRHNHRWRRRYWDRDHWQYEEHVAGPM